MKKRPLNRGSALKIVLIVLGAICLLVVISGIYVATHWKGWAATFAYQASQGLVKESGLPDDQRETILTEIRQLGDDFKSGKINNEDMAHIVKTISESPLLPLAGVQAVRTKYIEKSDMTPKEKSAAILDMQRFARGVYEKKINPDEVKDIVKPVSDIGSNGRWKLKENPTRMELEQFIANARARADLAKIPNESFDLNIAEELKKAIHSPS
jgi:hypothetical protein